MKNKSGLQPEELTDGQSVIKSLYTRLWTSIAVIFVMLAMLAGSTYAWFTSDALTKNNGMNAGVMAADLLMGETDLEAELTKVGSEKTKEDYAKYIRQINNEDYYIVTDEGMAYFKIEKAEPGQIYPVKMRFANTGQLAFTYVPYFEVSRNGAGEPLSFTGLEVLAKEKAASEEHTGVPFAEGDYTYDAALAEAGLLTNRDFETRKRVLEREQSDHGTDIGGHLENVLKVYTGTTEEDITEENYIGTISDIMGGALDYRGYLLPYPEIKDSLPDGKEVEIKDGATVIETKTGVTETEELSLLVKMPDDTGNLYQYASLILKIGIHIRQVEYEHDGFDIMIYDTGENIESWVFVKFDVQGKGTAPEPIEMKIGTAIIKPDDPEAEGYVFDGWFKDPECTIPWDFENYIIDGETTLYAGWSPVDSD